MNSTNFLSKRQVAAKTSLNPVSIYRMTLTGAFPRSVNLGNRRRVAWVESEVDQWIQDQIKASREPMSKAA